MVKRLPTKMLFFLKRSHACRCCLFLGESQTPTGPRHRRCLMSRCASIVSWVGRYRNASSAHLHAKSYYPN